MGFLEVDEEVDDFFGVWSSVDVVTHEDEVVFGGGGDDFEHFFKWSKASVQVSDCECSHVVEVGVAGCGGVVKSNFWYRSHCLEWGA